jgi:hypothetical protein
MLKVEAKAMVTYTCTLTDEDEKKVRDYARDNKTSLDFAIEELWFNPDANGIDIYAGEVTESDCNTEEVGVSEFNDPEDL